MVYNKFYINIVFRVLLIALNCLILFYYWWQPELPHLKFALVSILVFQVFLLILFLNRINRRLSMFFDAVKSDDYNVVYSDYSKRGEFRELNFQLDRLSKYFKQIKLENEKRDLYFKAVIDHVGTGILAFNETGRVKFINSFALELLGVNHLANISSLVQISPELSNNILSLKPGNQQLLEIPSAGEIQQVFAKSNVYKFEDEKLTLVSLQNIRPELEQRETQTWQRMIRVLTHEINNSIAPITSLAASLSKIVNEQDMPVGPDTAANRKLIKGLGTIRNRGKGLVDFVEKYRRLTILPEPKIGKIQIQELFIEVKTLFDEQIRNENIQMTLQVEPEDMDIIADREQMEQVLINLVKNALWAVRDRDRKEIELFATTGNDGKKLIKIFDNGCGIEPDLQNKIFIPFFTTHEEGSGIGLSLSRQIMLMHGGSISVQANPEKGSAFVLRFQG